MRETRSSIGFQYESHIIVSCDIRRGKIEYSVKALGNAIRVGKSKLTRATGEVRRDNVEITGP